MALDRLPVSAVIFDFGQVLIHFESENILSPYFSSASDRSLVASVLFDRLYWDALDAGTVSDGEVLAGVRSRLPASLYPGAESAYLNWFRYLPEFGGMRPIVRTLRLGGTPVYVLSNISRGFADHDSEIPILSEVDGKVYSSVCGFVKPSREIFDFICRKFSLDPSTTLFVDDNEKNIAGASAFGLQTYLFDGDVPAFIGYLRSRGLLSGKKTARIPCVSSRSAVDFSLCDPIEISEYSWDGSSGYRPHSECRCVLSENDSLFVRLSCEEKDPLVRYHGYMDPVWTDSCLEFFFSPDGRRYVNVEMNAGGGLCSCVGDGREGRIPVLDVCGEVFGVKAEKTENGWSATAELPLRMLEKLFGAEAVSSCFVRGGTFFANAYKCGDGTKTPHYGSWNPVVSPKPDFHRPESFGKMIVGK